MTAAPNTLQFEADERMRFYHSMDKYPKYQEALRIEWETLAQAPGGQAYKLALMKIKRDMK